MNKTVAAGATALALLAVPSVAAAHVTLQPKTAPAGAYTVQNVRVPNEKDNAATTKVEVQLPHGFAAASYQAVPGWTVKVSKAKLATPVETDDGPITEEVRRMTWTAKNKAAAIAPGQFRDFPLSVRIPGKAGDTLTFKALQTYSNGEVVRWIGAPDADEPAPQITVTAAEESHTEPVADPVPASSDGDEDGDDSGASTGLAISALVAGLLGIALGATALVRRRTA